MECTNVSSILVSEEYAIENVALGKTIKVSTGTVLSGLTDGDLSLMNLGGVSQNIIPRDDYAIIDLGQEYELAAVGIYGYPGQGAWNRCPMNLYGTNNPDGGVDAAQLLGNINQAVGTVHTAGVRHNVNIVDVTADSFKIDVSSLEAFVEYKLVINGVKDTIGEAIEAYTSETFKTGAISKIAYNEGKIIKNAAKNQTVTLYDSNNQVVTGKNIGNWFDGDAETSFNLSQTNQWSLCPDYYVVIDFGTPQKIDSIAAQSASTWYRGELGVYFKNSVEGVTIAAMNYRTITLNPTVNNMQQELLDKHYLRKHGKNAYYGQV